MVTAESSEHVLAAWRENDRARAIHPADRAAIDATESARALVLELFDRPERDLWSACARLGRLLADSGASPSLAVSTIDGCASAMRAAHVAFDETRLATARASVAEGYVSAVRDLEQESANRAWGYPSCVVVLDAETVAVAAGHPDAGDALAAWAAEVAAKVSRSGAKTAVIAGRDAAKRELGEALKLVGVEVADRLPARRSWLRLPWAR